MRYLLLFVCSFTVVSCASKQYIFQKKQLKPLQEHDKPVVWKANNSLRVYFHALKDRRPIKGQLGEIKTGVLRTSTPVLIDKPIAYFIKNELMKNLQKHQIHLVEDQADAELHIRGYIDEFWVSQYAPILGQQQVVCHAKLDLAVFKKNRKEPRWYGVSWVKVVSPQSFWSVREFTEPTVASCLAEFTKKWMSSPDLRAILEKG